VIVCGLHGVGLRVVEQLTLIGRDVVVVDESPDPRLVRAVAALDVPHVTGSALLGETLLDAGLAGAAAVVCVEDHDLRSLESALRARQLRPDVRVVIQLDNEAVGRAVSGLGESVRVQDVAALSAPSFVEACLQSNGHRLAVEGETFVVARSEASEDATLRHLYGDLAPIGVAAGEDLTICPGRDHHVSAGDRVTLLGTSAELMRMGVIPVERQQVAHLVGARGPRPARLPGNGGKLKRLIAGVAAEADRALRYTLLATLLLVLASCVVLKLGYRAQNGSRMSGLDALYFTIETIATVGFGDFSFAAQAPWLRIYAIGLMIAGAVLAPILFALLADMLVSRRLEQSFGRQQVTRMSGHVILIGLGSVGLRVLEQLRAADVPVVVIEQEEDHRHMAQARGLGASVVVGDATLGRTLAQVNLAAPSAVAVLTSDDSTNVETALAVRDQLGDRWDDVPVTVRVFDRHLAETLERGFGFRHVRSTSDLAAPWFVGAALGLDVLATFYVERQPFLLGGFEVAAESQLDGLAMADLGARTRVIALAPADGQGLQHPPRRGTRFAAGDRVYAIGPYEELFRVLSAAG
jgi:Trk K+ transport system NAD-binding subunit